MKLHSARLLASVCFSVAAFASSPAFAVDPFTVKDIRVEGIQRIDAGTIFSYLPVRVGETFTDEKGVAAIRALYATGFFNDVRIEAEGNVLVVAVEERPAIASVEFSGTREFDKDMLISTLKEVGVGESRIFDKALLDRAEQEIKNLYLSKGLYGVEVTTTVTPLERNRVNIQFAIDEGEVSRIREINIIGNEAFSDKQLQAQIKSTTPGWFTWLSKADRYSRQQLDADLEALRSFYLDRGYLEMEVESTQITISPDKNDIYITINIREGDKFTVSDVKLVGDMLGREEEFAELVTLKKGDVYSGRLLAESTREIAERMGNFGYAFANVNANPEINREKKEVAFTIFVDPGKRVYVRRINISGNTKTNDEVIRRELRQFESSWYDGEKIRLSRDRVDRLGYFSEVGIATPEVPGTTDQVDVDLRVAEKPTGNIMFGIGYSSTDRVTLTGSVHQDNVFGTGKSIGIDLNTSSSNRVAVLSFTDPYFTDEGVSISYDLFQRTTRPPEVNTGDYRVETAGGSVRLGVPFTEKDRVFFGIGVEKTEVQTFADSPQAYQQYVADFGTGNLAETTAVPMTVAWARDNRDSALTPSRGRYQRAVFEVSALGDLNYYRATYQHQYFKPMFANSILALNGEVNYGRGIGGEPYPVFKNFYAGGIGSVRGYRGASLSVDPAAGEDPIGGQSRIIMNAELQFPFPGSGQDRTLRWFTFLDGGQVFRSSESMNLGDLRYSYGLGLSWLSPVGPLKLSFGRPINDQPNDRLQSFQFQIGTGF
jgi:outer membrane protein insertion porin family